MLTDNVMGVMQLQFFVLLVWLTIIVFIVHHLRLYGNPQLLIGHEFGNLH